MNKRDMIALALWYERQPLERAAIWNTRHRQQPVWLKRQFAGYMSWKYMGGSASWWRKALTAAAFYLTCALYDFYCRDKPKQKSA